MKRWVLRIVLFLLPGAIVNVAVAWAAPLRWRDYESDSGNLQAGEGDWNWLKRQDWPVTEGYVFHSIRAGVGWRSDNFAFRRANDVEFLAPLSSWRDRSGWPLYALESYSETGSADFVGFTKWYGNMYLSGSLFGRPRDEGFVVNVSPIWPGFAINTVFYAGILYLLFASPFAIRRRRRIKRGVCPACAYPVGASDVCTECGAQVARPHGND